MSNMRRNAMLRLIPKPPREQACACFVASRHCIGGIGRTLALLLPGALPNGSRRKQILGQATNKFGVGRLFYQFDAPDPEFIGGLTHLRDPLGKASVRSHVEP
jgi:hypothetical protein